MNEIIRIHLAKIPYEIEVAAKKQLEEYLRTLELHADENDWVGDVEVRITEILSERNIQSGGLIASEDITAIRAQLGEPEDFFGEGDIAVGARYEAHTASSRRLYRDPSSAVLAGVLSGVAHYLKINPIWTRLAFIVLLFMSFGTAAIVYIVLWIVLPPATTAAAQLELSGTPVTLASIKEQRSKMGDSGNESRVAHVMQRILIYGTGALLAVAAAGTLVFTLWAGAGLIFGVSPESLTNTTISNEFSAWTALILFTLSGLLLSSLFSLLSVACFKRKFTKRIGLGLLAITIAGVLTFGSAVGTVAYASWQHTAQLNESRHTKTVKLPEQFNDIKALTIGSDGSHRDGNLMDDVAVEYVVSNGTPRYELTVDAETSTIAPKIAFNENGTAQLTFKDDSMKPRGFGHYQYPLLKIYGPALSDITVKSGAFTYSSVKQQEILMAKALSGTLNVKGAYGSVVAINEASGQVTLEESSIENLTVNLKGGLVSAGVVRTLAVTQPDVCPVHHSDYSENRLVVRAVASGVMTYNGSEREAKTIQSQCGDVIIGSEEDFENYIED